MLVRACKGNILLAVAGNCCLSSKSQSVLGAGYLDPVNLPPSLSAPSPEHIYSARGRNGGSFWKLSTDFPNCGTFGSRGMGTRF